jgi:hypothetical protein
VFFNFFGYFDYSELPFLFFKTIWESHFKLIFREVETNLTVLFGTVEFFEREILNYAINHQLRKIEDDHVSIIYSRMEDELKYDFVCDEKLRVECLENLSAAYQKILENDYELAYK